MMKKQHAEKDRLQVGLYACLAEPTAGLRFEYLKNKNYGVDNPDCLIRIIFFNNTNNQNHNHY
jgi:hypothetical protein